MSEEEFKVFSEDIKAKGLQTKITTHENKILEGRHRYKAARYSLNDGSFQQLPAGVNPVDYVISMNVNRRHLNESQRAMVAAKLANYKRGDNQHSEEGVSIETTSAMLNASRATTMRCKKVLADGVPKLATLVEKGTLPASVAEEVAKLPKDEQTELVQKSVKQIKAAVKGDEEVSDNLDGVEKAYVEKLQALKSRKPENAEAAVANLVKRLQDMGYKVTLKK
jgi:hypothetical protein